MCFAVLLDSSLPCTVPKVLVKEELEGHQTQSGIMSPIKANHTPK